MFRLSKSETWQTVSCFSVVLSTGGVATPCIKCYILLLWYEELHLSSLCTGGEEDYGCETGKMCLIGAGASLGLLPGLLRHLCRLRLSWLRLYGLWSGLGQLCDVEDQADPQVELSEDGAQLRDEVELHDLTQQGVVPGRMGLELEGGGRSHTSYFNDQRSVSLWTHINLFWKPAWHSWVNIKQVCMRWRSGQWLEKKKIEWRMNDRWNVVFGCSPSHRWSLAPWWGRAAAG